MSAVYFGQKACQKNNIRAILLNGGENRRSILYMNDFVTVALQIILHYTRLGHIIFGKKGP